MTYLCEEHREALEDCEAIHEQRYYQIMGVDNVVAVLAGYADARDMHGDSYADYLIESDRELLAKGYVPRPWPLSLQGNEGI